MEIIFDEEFLSSLYSSDEGEKRLLRIKELLNSGQQFLLNNNGQYPRSVQEAERPLQADKDETILTLFTFAALTLCGPKAFERLLKKCFPDKNWGEKVNDIKVELEKAISPSNEILELLKREAKRHPIKYLRKISEHEKPIETKTHFDAVLSLGDTKVFVECKFTSDISYETTHVTNRNQIARCIDVGLAYMDDNLDNFFFLLITPKRYQEFPGSRLYYYKMNEYRTDPLALAMDIKRLESWYEDKVNHSRLERLTNHIGWLTWEECLEVIMKSDSLSPKQKDKLKNFYRDRLLYDDSEDDLPL